LDDVALGVRLASGFVVDLANGKPAVAESRTGTVDRCARHSISSVIIPLIDRIADHPPTRSPTARRRAAQVGRRSVFRVRGIGAMPVRKTPAGGEALPLSEASTMAS
jgi:hypothetical protein